MGGLKAEVVEKAVLVLSVFAHHRVGVQPNTAMEQTE
jgi:hypothetical protein